MGECYIHVFMALPGVFFSTPRLAEPLTSTPDKADVLNKALTTGAEGLFGMQKPSGFTDLAL